MINSALLDEKIEQSGLKVTFIVETLGISRQAFYKKKNGKTPFRKSEIYVICDLLKITETPEKLSAIASLDGRARMRKNKNGRSSIVTPP